MSLRWSSYVTPKSPKGGLKNAKRPTSIKKQDAQLSQSDRAAGYVIIFAKSRRLELEDNIVRTL